MKVSENDNPQPDSGEALLRFLELRPHGRSPSQLRDLPETWPRRQECHPAGTYMRVALGTVPEKEADRLLEHAAACEACGELLAASLSALEGNPSAEEAIAIAELAAVRTEWQQKMALQLAATKTRRRPMLAYLPARRDRWLAGSAIAAGLLVAAGLFLWQRQANSPEHQLSKAYTESRTLELRIPGAAYAALAFGGRTRGAAAETEGSYLLEARARLVRELKISPQNPHWLELQARADVLEEKYDSAADVLDRLVVRGPVTPELLTDAAAAYYQRGLITNNQGDRTNALDYLRRADELAPTDPVVLFNEAIVMEDRGQIINAVEVWNRYITVERDANWAAEGRRKLAALEQTLNRLKTHESRIQQMLATPEAMDALAGNPQKLASLDEELSAYQLDKLLPVAFPVASLSVQASGAPGFHPSRGSPCDSSCLAARRLLKATGSSLELQHHDPWLTDLISPDIASIPAPAAATYAQALQLLARATGDNNVDQHFDAQRLSGQSRELFQALQHIPKSTPALLTAARVGEERAAIEYMFSLQRFGDFTGCRDLAQQMNSWLQWRRDSARYAWMDGQAAAIEKVCDDTPETRKAGRAREAKALQVAEAHGYWLLNARVHLMIVLNTQDAGDEESAERLTLATLRELLKADPPLARVVNTIVNLPLIEQDSSHPYATEIFLRESIDWLELAGARSDAAGFRVHLAGTEIRIGAVQEAARQLHLAREEDPSTVRKSGINVITESQIFLMAALLERGDLTAARQSFEEIQSHMQTYSDTWALRTYAAASGMLNLAQGDYDRAAGTLESEIRSSEGTHPARADQVNTAEYAQQDHDLYAELAATWLAQGRSPASILALWERFRLRSRGLPIAQCPGGSLDCDQPRLVEVQHQLGNAIVVGQIVLMDRVLTYRMDKDTIQWQQRALRRQEVEDSAQKLVRAMNSPYGSPETIAALGANLSALLLPRLPASPDAPLLLESDPLFQSLAWPALPTPTGSLGLKYPLAELSSILAPIANRGSGGPLSGKWGSSLIIGASTAGANEPPLPEALQEAGSVGAHLPSPELLVGEEATADRVAAALGSATIFHFAGHAVQTEDGTELLLAAPSPDDRRPWVDGTFLRQHPPRACRLAVLSACATGARRASWKHPEQDIVQTLGSLGVPEVVATRWQVDSQASVAFMDAFYASLSQGNSVAVALTSARRVICSQPLYNNPYYWGAYYVTGREVLSERGESHARL